MLFDVGITVLRQYEELARCLQSVRNSSLAPNRIIVIDNGRQLGSQEGVTVVTPSTNLGVAASWNLLLSMIHPLPAIILNDDCEVAKDTFRLMMSVQGPCLVTACGWSCFRHDYEVRQRVGSYDESFWPAYYEDSDYAHRMKLAGMSPVNLGDIVASHGNHGERPYQNFTQEEMSAFQRHLENNKSRFIAKWGGLPSDL